MQRNPENPSLVLPLAAALALGLAASACRVERLHARLEDAPGTPALERAAIGPATDVAQEPAAPPAELEELGTLEAVRARALLVNPGARAAFESWQAALERAPQVGALPDPRVTWSYYVEEVETRVGPQRQAIGLTQGLPWPGRRGLRAEVADAAAATAGARFRAKRTEVRLGVDRAWFEGWYLQRSIEIVRRNRDLFVALEEVLRRRYGAGQAEFVDLIRVQVELGKLEDRLRTLADQERPIVARINALLDRAPDAPLSWPASLSLRAIPVGDARVAEWIRVHNPELAVVRHEVERSSKSVELARLESRPDLTLGLQWIDTGSAQSPNVPDSGKDPWIASLSLNLPIWSSRTHAASEEARARKRATSLELEDVARRVEAEGEDALYRIRDALRRHELYEATLLPRARQVLETQDVAFRAGNAPFLDLVDAERTLLEFELSLARARADGEIAVSRLERLAGRPLETLTPDTPDHDEQLEESR